MQKIISSEDQLLIEQVHLCYDQSRTSSFLLVFLNLIIWYYFKEQVPTVYIWFWCYFVFLIFRQSLIWYMLKKVVLTPLNVHRWNHMFQATVLVMALFYPVFCFFFFPEDVGVQNIFTFMVAGIVATGTVVQSPVRKTPFFFLVPILFSLIIRMLMYGDDVHNAMAMMIALASIMYIVTAEKVHKVFKTSLSLKFEKDDLIDQLEYKNDQITKSINYGSKIQRAILPSSASREGIGLNHFVIYIPRDIVSGDFFWMHKASNNKLIWAVIDCTGHGIPGAFMSMIGTSLLNTIIKEEKVYDPGLILDKMREGIIVALNQDAGETKQDDGMAMTICILDPELNTMLYSCSENKIYVVTKSGEKHILKGSAQNISMGMGRERHKPFPTKTIQLSAGDMVYSYTDGFVDQPGGPKNERYYSNRFQDFLDQIAEKNIDDQREEMDNEIIRWMGDNDQRDDICLMGVRL